MKAKSLQSGNVIRHPIFLSDWRVDTYSWFKGVVSLLLVHHDGAVRCECMLVVDEDEDICVRDGEK